MNNIWESLILFETRDHVERLFKRKHNRSPSARAVLEITSNFIQGREYFSNAIQSGIAVRPLLLYYGVLALSRGLILACSPRLSESALKPSHGLEVQQWRDVLKAKDFGKLEIVIGNGTFYELLNATGNKSYLKANSSAVNWQISYDMPFNGSLFSLDDLLRSMPDMAVDYKTWCEKEMATANLAELRIRKDDEKYEIKFESALKREIIDVLFPFEICSDIENKESLSIVSFSNSFTPFIAQKWEGPFNIGDACVVPPIRKNIYLNTLSIYFAISFVLGMMARYFPATWVSLSRVEKGDSFFPLVNRLLSFIQDKYPQLVWDFINGPYKFELPTSDSESA